MGIEPTMTDFADLRLNRLGYARIISKLRAGIEPARLKHGILVPRVYHFHHSRIKHAEGES